MRIQSKYIFTMIALIIALGGSVASARATEIWGRITGLGNWQTINYISSVSVRDEYGNTYQGRAGYSTYKGGLYWAADVPTFANRSYQVWVRSTLTPDMLWWNPETAYGSWSWTRGTVQQGPDVRFYLRL